jgi:hypothetical protein
MGRSGDLLRAQKAQRATYTFTAEQLREHDRQVAQDAVQRKRDDLIKGAHAFLTAEFEERQRLLSGTATDVTARVFAMLISISCRVLVEHFKWSPVWGESRHYRLARFVDYVKEEAERIVANEMADIRTYVAETYEITGVMLTVDEDKEEGGNHGQEGDR